MTTSSQQPDYSTILSSDDVVTITGYDPTETLTISSPSIYDYSTNNSISTISITGGSGSTYSSIYSIGTDTISFPDLSNITITVPTEFVNTFPNWDKIEKMRKEYPGLDIAMKKFEEVYKMVEDDWQAQQGNKYGSNRS